MSLSETWPLAFILIAGALPTYFWRWLGVLLAGKLHEDSELLKWVKAVATTLIAGVIARLVLFPNGALVEVPLWLRIAAIAGGFTIAFMPRGHMLAGIVAGEVFLVVGALFFS
ncbi:MAG: branched-chain amino acid transport [Hyphomicrobiales bacterium]|nr:MAG: branched-chain amino acid transport [Hyphomicrobiales bacterium]